MQIESIQRQPQNQEQEEQQLRKHKTIQEVEEGERESEENEVLLTTFLTRTKCTKMTDESDLIKNGINGASSATSIATSNNNNNNDNHSNNNNNSSDRRNSSSATLKSDKSFGNNNDTTGRTTTDRVITSVAATTTGTTILTTVVSTRNGRGKCDLLPPPISSETDNRSRTPSTSNPWTAVSEALATSSSTPSLSPSNMMVSVSSNISNNNVLSNPKSNTSTVDTHSSLQPGIGGRLQFFKDGKFILELARTKDGEKEGWVSVPRKTFWPLSTNTIIYPKNESSASLSFSDDNSSVQSSPWQRDHCWKQTTPRKNISKEMCMYFKRTRKFTLSTSGYRTSLLKRRRPYDNSVCKKPFSLPNGIKQKLPEEEAEERQDNNADDNDIVDGNHHEMDVDKAEGKVINRINGNSKRFSRSTSNRAKLTSVIQKLIDRLPSSLLYSSKTSIGSGVVHPISPYGPSRLTDLHHHPQQHVSPRKRILRELEKVSLEDNTNKRCRAKSSTIFSPSSVSQSTFPLNSGGGTSSSLPSTSSSSTSSHAVTSNPINVNSSTSRGNQHIYNGNSASSEQASGSSRLYSSYSIHSLLGNAINNSSNSNSKTESSTNQNLKDINDPSYLRNMLSKSSEISSIHHLNKSSSSAFTNNFKRSPNYSPHHEGHSRTRSPSTECENLSGGRLKALNASPNATSSFHPYIPCSSPKYSSNLLHSGSLNDGYKIRSGSGRRSSSPSAQQHLLSSHHGSSISSDRSPPLSTLPHSPQSLRYSSRASPPVNNSIISSGMNNSNHIRSNKELSPISDNISSRLEQRREGTPRTVPKKTAALRQQFSSPTSLSPNTSQQGEISIPASINYSSSSGDHTTKKRNTDEHSSLSPADKQRSSNSPSSSSLSSPYHHAQLDLDHGINNVLRSSVMSPSAAALYYMGYPRHGSPVTAHASTTPYIPPVSYYHPYAAAVAALRNPLWMHYQAAAAATAAAGVLPPTGTSSSRVGSAVSFPYNGASPGPPPSPLQTPFAPSLHLSPSIGSMKSWQPSSPQNLTTEDPVSLAIKKEEPSSDTPLNLSKH